VRGETLWKKEVMGRVRKDLVMVLEEFVGVSLLFWGIEVRFSGPAGLVGERCSTGGRNLSRYCSSASAA
jgi:hypothetical protein